MSGSFSCSTNLRGHTSRGERWGPHPYFVDQEKSGRSTPAGSFFCASHTHQSMACSIPWFPVLATAFSLKTGHFGTDSFTFTSVKVLSNAGTIKARVEMCVCGVTHALFLSKPISSRLSSVVSSAILIWNRLYTLQYINKAILRLSFWHICYTTVNR